MPLPLLVGLGVLTAGAGVLAAAEIAPLTPARAIGAGGAQGALLATAVAWARGDSYRRPAPAWAAAAVLAGAVGATLSPFGVVAYLAAPVWLWRQRERLVGLGLARSPVGACAAGAVLGAVLGAHLLLTASLTLGYGVRVPTLAHLAPWLAYDAGANVLTTEAFFRGALLDRAQRRWAFAPAAVFVTILCLARYFVDPLLPHSLEVTAGAIFYLTLLSLANCWMYWRSGSIVPGVAAGISFFACYRLLHVVS
jgi:membrane protease YdiL (CAAX protease family)